MSQEISAPDEEWIEYIARMLILGARISTDVLGQEMDGSKADLSRIQEILNSEKFDKRNEQELHSLGYIFGKVFIENNSNYDWWVLEDECGKDACIRYKETTLVTFPQTIISKRVEDDEDFDVEELYEGLQHQLDEIRREHYENA